MKRESLVADFVRETRVAQAIDGCRQPAEIGRRIGVGELRDSPQSVENDGRGIGLAIRIVLFAGRRLGCGVRRRVLERLGIEHLQQRIDRGRVAVAGKSSRRVVRDLAIWVIEHFLQSIAGLLPADNSKHERRAQADHWLGIASRFEQCAH